MCVHARLRNAPQLLGGSFGIGYGPIITANKDISPSSLKDLKIAIPGKMTSAYLLLRLMIGEFEYREMNFSDIPAAVAAGSVDAGLVIHETQLSYVVDHLLRIREKTNGFITFIPLKFSLDNA